MRRRRGDLRYVALRYFNASGADREGEIGERHTPETHLIPLALMAAYGTGPALKVFGTDYETPDGTCIRDYIHVEDLAQAHVLAMAHLTRGGESLAANLGTGQGASVLEVIAAVEQATGRSVPVTFEARRAGGGSCGADGGSAIGAGAPRVRANTVIWRRPWPMRPRGSRRKWRHL